MELRKLAVAMDNAKHELKKGIIIGFEKEILNEYFARLWLSILS